MKLAVQYNAHHERWDMALFAGNFSSQEEARAYADRVAAFLEREADGVLERVQ